MPDYRAIARSFAVSMGINPDIFEKQIDQESGFQPLGKDGKPLRSSAGAIGIAQIVPRYHPNVDPTDPIASLRYAAQLDKDALRKYQNKWEYALVAYNAGPGVADVWNGQKDDPKLPAESRSYLSAILGGDWTTTGDSGGSWNPLDWLGAWFTQVKGGFEQTADQASSRVADVAINVAGGFAGVTLISYGLFAAAVRSAPGQVVLKTAETIVPAARPVTAVTRAAAGQTPLLQPLKARVARGAKSASSEFQARSARKSSRQGSARTRTARGGAGKQAVRA